jgi:nitroreductase
MAVLAQIRQRYSVRAYRDRPVEPEKLKNVLEAACQAPSARNMQDWRLVVAQDAETRRRLMAAANGQPFVGQAPVVVACCATQPDYVMRCGQPSGPIDVAIAMDHMTLQAVEEGLGTCWIGSFYEDQVKAVLNIPDSVRVIELLTLGYAADSAPASKKREPLDDMVSYETWRF